MYNVITGKNEEARTCSSCLRARAREIKKWYDEGLQASKKPADGVDGGTGADSTATVTAKVSEGKVTVKGADVQENGKLGDVQDNTDITEEQAKAAEEELGKIAAAEKEQTDKIAAEEANIDPNGLPEPALGVSRIPLEDGTFIDFTPAEGAAFENGVKGLVATPQGDKVKAGTYKTAKGHEVRVQVGSKATYAENYDDLAS